MKVRYYFRSTGLYECIHAYAGINHYFIGISSAVAVENSDLHVVLSLISHKQ